MLLGARCSPPASCRPILSCPSFRSGTSCLFIIPLPRGTTATVPLTLRRLRSLRAASTCPSLALLSAHPVGPTTLAGSLMRLQRSPSAPSSPFGSGKALSRLPLELSLTPIHRALGRGGQSHAAVVAPHPGRSPLKRVPGRLVRVVQ